MADRTGRAKSAAFIDATGPSSQVRGASGMPKASTLVSSRRLSPPGGKTVLACSREAPWVSAQAGYSTNHR